MLNRKIKGQEFRKRRPFYFSLLALIDKLKVATIRKFYSTERIENPMEEEQQRREKEKEMWNLKQEKRLCSAWVLTGQEISAKHLTSKYWVVVSIRYSSYKSISFEHAYMMSWTRAEDLTNHRVVFSTKQMQCFHLYPCENFTALPSIIGVFSSACCTLFSKSEWLVCD